MAIVDKPCATFVDIENHLIAENNDENLSTIMEQILALIPKQGPLSSEQAESLLSVFDSWFKKALSSTANQKLSPPLYALTIKFIDKIHKSKQNIFNLPEKANPALLYLIYEKINDHIWMLIDQKQDSQSLREAALAAIQTVQKLQYFAKDISLPTPSSPKEKEKINPVEKDMELLSKIYYGSTNNEIALLYDNVNKSEESTKRKILELFAELLEFTQAFPQLLQDLKLTQSGLKSPFLKQTLLNLNNISITALNYYARIGDETILELNTKLTDALNVVNPLITENEKNSLDTLLQMLNTLASLSATAEDFQKELIEACDTQSTSLLSKTALSKTQLNITALWDKSQNEDTPEEQEVETNQLNQLFFIISRIVSQVLDLALIDMDDKKTEQLLNHFDISTPIFYAQFPKTKKEQHKDIINKIYSSTELYYYLKNGIALYQTEKNPSNLLITFLGNLSYLVLNNIKKIKSNKHLTSLILSSLSSMLPILKDHKYFFSIYLALLATFERYKVPHETLKSSFINFINQWHQEAPKDIITLIGISLAFKESLFEINNRQPISSSFLCLALFHNYLSSEELISFFKKVMVFVYKSAEQQLKNILQPEPQTKPPRFVIDEKGILQIIEKIKALPINSSKYKHQIELLQELPDFLKVAALANKDNSDLNKFVKDNTLLPKLQEKLKLAFTPKAQRGPKYNLMNAVNSLIFYITPQLLNISRKHLIETPIGKLYGQLEKAIIKDINDRNSTAIREFLAKYGEEELFAKLGESFVETMTSLKEMDEFYMSQLPWLRTMAEISSQIKKCPLTEIKEDIEKVMKTYATLLQLYQQFKHRQKISDDDLLAAFEPKKPKKRKAKKKKPTKATQPKPAQGAEQKTQDAAPAQKPQRPLQQVGIFAQQPPQQSLPFSKSLKAVTNQTVEWLDTLNKNKHRNGVDFPSILTKIKANLDKITNEKLEPATYGQLYIRIKKQVAVLGLRSFKYAINSNNLYRNILELYNTASFKTPEENKEYAYTTCFQIYRRCLPDGKLSAKQNHPGYWRDYCDIIVALNTLLRMSVNAPIELQQPIKRSKSIC